MKTEVHYGILMYPKSSTSYLAVDAIHGHPQIFARRSAAVEERRKIKVKPMPKVVKVVIRYESKKP